jgi:hypothetical protein
MNPLWEESEFVFCDLQTAARFIRRDNPAAARAFPEYIKEQDGKLLSPYDSPPPLQIGDQSVAVAEGTGAIRAYEAMVYGVEKDDPKPQDNWKRLLLQYCKLDTLSMVMVWRHWNQIITNIPAWLPDPQIPGPWKLGRKLKRSPQLPPLQ